MPDQVTVLSTGAPPRETADSPRPPARVVALDVVRGVTIVGMLLVNNTGDPAATPTELSHSPWHGLTVADLVFPLFPFAVGVAMPMSSQPGRCGRCCGAARCCSSSARCW
ncbi:MAG TPA: hypothetical protein VEZ46_15145 [Mycobacteriales bacterium]|nr:hypothetical protein [Mycobacteriales bacterium]